jgi:hypothetical protein
MRARSSIRLGLEVASLGVASSMVAFGCGGKLDGFDVEAREGSYTSDASSIGTSLDASATSADANMSADAKAEAAPEDAGTRVEVTLEYSAPSFINLDCRPDGSTMPLGIDVGADFESPAGQGPQAVTFPAARVVFTKGAMSLTWSFDVMMEAATPAPPPPLVNDALWNAPGSDSYEGTGSPCDYCGGMAEFDLEVSGPGQSAYWTAAHAPVECAQ